ncbi:tyrosine-protein phosphatase [Streptomyces formicae]|uniref:Tyrosine-protein phosphatase n=1 Tax=Streptomyces formicae TaxID=1616117 RepID=A0ABY3WW89_9ACTN|nr:tyrosine-protein phosphatase [Streptomyces formicae]UNM15714.1 tyrosine-protein phosphatase [Streptomyces formicae]
MTLLTRVTSVKAPATCAAVAAAALLTGLVAPGAAAAHPHHSPAHHGQSRAEIPFTAATVTAGDDGSYTVSWNAPGVRKVSVRAGGRTVARGDGRDSVVVRGLPAADRQWFDLVPERGGSLRLADRLVRLEGTVNFRDAGGYRTRDGQWVKMGEIYRSDSLEKLTAGDLAKLARLGVRTVFDLRMESERTSAPDKVPAGATHVVADVIGDSPAFGAMPTTEAEAVKMMVDGEKVMVSGESAKAAYTSVFGGIADADKHAVLFHCTAGKDRTGWSNAALLTALGVPRETVMADYLASNVYRRAANEAILAHMTAEQSKVYKPLLDVRTEYLNSGFAEVQDEYGSFNRYLDKALGINARELRELRKDLLVG